MSIKIHHGAPGSYKTSGAIMDDFIPAVRSGRVVVTNVRGLSDRDHVLETLDLDTPESHSFELIWVDTASREGRERLARWWHWAPKGALLIIDEAQLVFPKRWRDAELRLLDYPGGVDAAERDNRPVTFEEAFDMHRHHNWDLVLSTPKITKIREDIRGASEGAFKHRNMGLIGIKGRYKEAFHLAEDNGTSASDFITVRNRRIPPHVFALYKSTTTGVVSDTAAGLAAWKNPKIVGMVVFVAGLIAFAASRPTPTVFRSAVAVEPEPVVAGGGSGAAVASPPVVVPPPAPAPGRVDTVSRDEPDILEPLDGLVIWVSAYISGKDRSDYLLSIRKPGGSTWVQRVSQIEQMGYTLQSLGECVLRLTHTSGASRVVTCGEPAGVASATPGA